MTIIYEATLLMVLLEGAVVYVLGLSLFKILKCPFFNVAHCILLLSIRLHHLNIVIIHRIMTIEVGMLSEQGH